VPREKIGFRRLLMVLGILVIRLLAAAFILGNLFLKRTQVIVSDDFQQQEGSTGTSCLVDLQPEYAAASQTEERRAAS
jgi:hypothetical protein